MDTLPNGAEESLVEVLKMLVTKLKTYRKELCTVDNFAIAVNIAGDLMSQETQLQIERCTSRIASYNTTKNLHKESADKIRDYLRTLIIGFSSPCMAVDEESFHGKQSGYILYEWDGLIPVVEHIYAILAFACNSSKVPPSTLVTFEDIESLPANVSILPRPNTLWRHYKGGIYRVICVSEDKLTKEVLVNYVKETVKLVDDDFKGPNATASHSILRGTMKPYGRVYTRSLLNWYEGTTNGFRFMPFHPQSD